MDIRIVIQQMIVMLIIIFIGYFFTKKGKLNDLSSRHISGLVVNVCNPAMLVCSAFSADSDVSGSLLLTALLATLFIYAILLAAGFVIPRVMGYPKEEHYIYHFLTVYGNVGFLGIPLVSAVLGSSALIYVSINVLIFNILFYLTGLNIIRKKAGVSTASGPKDILSKLINIGTVSALFTIIFYLSDIKVPMLVTNTLDYTGRATTFLSMLVLGIAVAQMPLQEIFCHGKDYLFLLIRMIALPVLCVLLLRCFVADPLILGVCCLMVSVPAANLPMMSSREHGLRTAELTRIIILSTLLSVLTIPVVVSFL